MDANGRELGVGAPPVALEWLIAKIAPVAQMDRAADFESVGREFESPQARQLLSIRSQTSSIQCKSQAAGPKGDRDVWRKAA
jgi:hypothetical protein